ncbi:hypothetical protein IU433_12165 [Nocardia puris]|uniref:hypothetical protein n=1 Tax=Nocardia puris TaxID=208602 RepID=UPI001895DBB7|nr:hypothetical protein [Nocardia puris]MBF6459791.1 hypothetical protein [Nocardia puris]
MLQRLLDLAAREPVAVRLVPALLAIVAYLVTRGTIDDQLGELLIALVVALLGGGAIAGARARVTPVEGGRHRSRE